MYTDHLFFIKAYINPQASSKSLIRVSHLSCIIYSICMAAISTGLYYGGIRYALLFGFGNPSC